MSTDEKYMRMAIGLALRAEGLTNPNPLVGAVIVKQKKIVGKGYHKRCGLAHAEVNALNDAQGKAKGATLYVTLEPCDHFGRTPPCTDAIIKNKIKKVVIGMRDPNPINSGRGIRKLNRRGVRTVVGVLEEESRSLNKPYLKFITKKVPYITIKIAESLDGKIATRTGDSKWITSEDARRYVHGLRGKVDAVMVGVNTVIKDDPMLLSKYSNEKQPIRIIVDSNLKTPLNAKIFSNARIYPVIIATTKNVSRTKIRRYEAKGARFLFLTSKKKNVDLRHLVKVLGRMTISHILVEGGGELIASLIEERLADRFLFFIAPKIIGGRTAITPVEGEGIKNMTEALLLNNVRVRKFEDDILVEAEAS